MVAKTTKAAPAKRAARSTSVTADAPKPVANKAATTAANGRASTPRTTPAAVAKRVPANPKTATPKTAAPKTGGKAKPRSKPHGRDEVIESIIDATLSLWSARGPAELSMRSIAARADVNYGLVHRHFGTKEAVIRAAMDRVVVRSLGFIQDSENLSDVVDNTLPRSTGAHARLLAWAILQYFVDDVMPEENTFLNRLRDLAAVDVDATSDDADVAAKIKAGSMLAMLYGWRLFEPYLVRGLELEGLSHDELDAYVRADILKVIQN